MAKHRERSGRPLGSGRLFRKKAADGKVWWHLAYRDADHNRRQLRLSTNRRESEIKRVEIIRERDLIMLGLHSVAGRDLRLSEISTPYVSYLRIHRRPGYANGTHRILTGLIQRFGDRRVRDLRVSEVEDYRDSRLSPKRGVRTCNMEINSLRYCLNWAVKRGMIVSNPIAHVVPLTQEEEKIRKNGRALSEDEVRSFIEAAASIDQERSDYKSAARTIASGTKGRTGAALERGHIPSVGRSRRDSGNPDHSGCDIEEQTVAIGADPPWAPEGPPRTPRASHQKPRMSSKPGRANLPDPQRGALGRPTQRPHEIRADPQARRYPEEGRQRV